MRAYRPRAAGVGEGDAPLADDRSECDEGDGRRGRDDADDDTQPGAASAAERVAEADGDERDGYPGGADALRDPP